MNKRNLRTRLALKIAPWLKPGEPVAREWTLNGRLESLRGYEQTAAPSEVTWKGSWADRVSR